MSGSMRDASVQILFGGDERNFRLGIDQLIALEDVLDCGFRACLVRLLKDEWRVRDVREPIRLALIGGGSEPKKAKVLVDEFVVPGRFAYAHMVAKTILAAVLDDGGEPVGKKVAAAPAPEGNASPLPPSSEPAPH
jgi:hypothetical protein